MVGDFIFTKTIWMFDIWCLFIKIVINNLVTLSNTFSGAEYTALHEQSKRHRFKTILDM